MVMYIFMKIINSVPGLTGWYFSCKKAVKYEFDAYICTTIDLLNLNKYYKLLKRLNNGQCTT